MTSFNFASLLRVAAETVPDRIALVHGQRELTYRQLDEMVDRFAGIFAARGLGTGDNVGLQLMNCPEYLAAFFGACRIKAVPFNINYRYSPAELQYLYENSNARMIIFNREFSDAVVDACRLGKKPPHLLEIGGAQLAEASAAADQFAEADCADNDIIIIYTGGTTGYPKGVMWPHKHLFFSALGGGGFFHADGPVSAPDELRGRIEDGMALTTMPLAPLMHGAALWTTLVALFAGHKVVLSEAPGFDAARAWALIRQYQVNIVSIVGDAMALPLVEVLETRHEEEAWQLDHLFHVGSGGAIFSEAIQKRFSAVLPNLFVSSSLGATETGTVGSGDLETSEGIMRYAARDDLAVVVDGTRLAMPGEEGVLARSGMVPVGYFGDEEKTRETFVTVNEVHYALGGDAARLEADGSITVLGRGSMCINTGGEKVFPEEVEAMLKGHMQVQDVLVVGLPNPKWGQAVTAVYSADAEIPEDELKDWCRQSLAGYKVPRRFVHVPAVQRTVVGKPDYRWALAVAEERLG